MCLWFSGVKSWNHGGDEVNEIGFGIFWTLHLFYYVYGTDRSGDEEVGKGSIRYRKHGRVSEAGEVTYSLGERRRVSTTK